MNLSGRQLKKKLHRLLKSDDFFTALDYIGSLPPPKVINPLLGLLYDEAPVVKWRTVSAIGIVVAGMAEGRIEAARVILRRLMWNLNDESGGIGWGSAEAMGEVLARSPRLAAEFADILVSYIRPDGNYLEHAPLRRGAVWGVGRLAHADARRISYAISYLSLGLESEDDTLRGLSCWAMAALPDLSDAMLEKIKRLHKDTSEFDHCINSRFVTCTVGQMAALAVESAR